MKKKPLFPLLPVILFVIWLILNESLSVSQMMLGIILALILSVFTLKLRPLPAWPKRIMVCLRLIFTVLIDILVSNCKVALLVFRATRQQPNAGFIDIPLTLKDPHGLAMLSLIICAAPGTTWAGLSEDNVMTLHIIDLQDEGPLRYRIRQQFEKPLMEIFE